MMVPVREVTSDNIARPDPVFTQLSRTTVIYLEGDGNASSACAELIGEHLGIWVCGRRPHLRSQQESGMKGNPEAPGWTTGSTTAVKGAAAVDGHGVRLVHSSMQR
ncbi:uncharacterized protein [Triticum aestivum]|uniref:uncharacterized protein n=1 Tax=Triticum aestivum TaxID=4565 RepID=UPI001D02AD87|nr:uncharacterized protein LOC123059185 [Triticum aestivum]